MRSPDGYYYLHSETKDMIFKKVMPELDSPFVQRVWPIFVDDRMFAWFICVEGLALGASRGRIWVLKNKWGLTDEDAEVFARKSNLKLWKEKHDGKFYAAFPDYVDLKVSQVGCGETALEALAELAKLGLRGQVDKKSQLLRSVEKLTAKAKSTVEYEPPGKMVIDIESN